MKIVHTIASLRAEHGGPSRTVAELCAAVSSLGAPVEIVTTDEFRGVGTFKRELQSRLSGGHQGRVVHDHGIWLPSNHVAASVAGSLSVPRIVSPRGMLSTWALTFHRIRKSVAWRVYQRGDLRRARVLHATSAMELAEIRALGLTMPVAVIPNGVRAPREQPRERRTSPKRVLFLSRIHPKKGLSLLLEAWARLAPRGWQLLIVGPGDGDHVQQLRALAANLGVQESVEFRGAIDDDAKWSLYRDADLFVLPTLSENFGMVVAEALASGVPVITTTAAPWEGMLARRCGWWVDPNTDALASALAEGMALTDDARDEMGRRGRAYVDEEFSWRAAALSMTQVYEWMLNGGSAPRCVAVA